MPLDDLIPIGGVPGGKSAKRDGPSDLTSGLISITGARANVDVDMDDFDIGDLLGDGSGKSKSKSKDKFDDSSSKKKKKSKDKDKSKSSSSSKKKSKSKSKKSTFDDDDFGSAVDEWAPSSKAWDSAAELEMAAAAAARRKNAKPSGGMDDEFAKMLGFDSGDAGSGVAFESPPLSPEPVATMNDDTSKFDDDFGISSYKPTVRGSKKADSSRDTSSNEIDDVDTNATKGVSAAFFQDGDEGVKDSSSLSFLGSTTERRGGLRGGRRQAGAMEDDPFGQGSTAKSSSSALYSLFGASSKKSNFDDLVASTSRGSSEVASQQQKNSEDSNEDTFRGARQAATVSAKDDLLADLFLTESRSSSRSQRQQQEQGPIQTTNPTTSFKEKKNEKAEITPEVTPKVIVDSAKQQNDLLAELFAAPSASKSSARETSIQRHEEPKPQTQPRTLSTSSKSPTSTEDAGASAASARDSLLMDLLNDASPPKSSEPALSRRRSRNNSNGSNAPSPEKELSRKEDDFIRSPPASSAQPQPLPSVPEVPVARPETPPSPGQRRTLTINANALAIRENEFEQSKDSLLEEILPSSPMSAASPSPRRRNSYSQSFEADEDYEDLAGSGVKHPSTNPIITEAPPMSLPESLQTQDRNSDGDRKLTAPACNCDEREAATTAAFESERSGFQLRIDELTQQLGTQTAFSNELRSQLESHGASTAQLSQQLEAQQLSNNQLSQQLEAQKVSNFELAQQLEIQQASNNQLSQQLETRIAANAQLVQQLATANNEKLQADQLAATSKDDAASYQHRAELLENELRSLREELSRAKKAVQDVELTLARNIAKHDEVDQLERHREKRALEALSAQLQRALARLAVSQQVNEEGLGYDTSAARVAAEDEARLRVIASLEGSSKRAAQHAEEERAKLAELLRELEANTRNARQGALEDKERLRQEQQRLDALSVHLQAQTAALRDQEASHAAYMGQQLAEAREDARIYEARLATRRTQLERDERALYETRAEFAAFREQTALEIEREHEKLRASRLTLEDAWRELRADREDLEHELASHEGEFQALESLRQEVQQAEARLAERSQEVVTLAKKVDAGTQELLAREQLVAEQAAVVQNADTSFSDRERALERVKADLEAREHRLHVQIRQLDSARGRFTQQRLEQQQLMSATRRHYTASVKPSNLVVDNNKTWRQHMISSSTCPPSNNQQSPVKTQVKRNTWQTESDLDEDPSGLTPALRRQVEANWQRRGQSTGRQRSGTGLKFDLHDFEPIASLAMGWSAKTTHTEAPTSCTSTYTSAGATAKSTSVATQQKRVQLPHQSPHQAFHKQQDLRQPSISTKTAQPQTSRMPPPPSTRSSESFQPSLRINL